MEILEFGNKIKKYIGEKTECCIIQKVNMSLLHLCSLS